MYKFNLIKDKYIEMYNTCTINITEREKDKLKELYKIGFNRYFEVSKIIGCPFELIFAIHYRESTCNFKTHLHNGDPLTDRTVHVPKGRPKTGEPPFTWQQSAIDALTLQGFDTFIGWDRVEVLLYHLEMYNGFGYRSKKINSPYLWNRTNFYTKGKFVKDGRYDKNFIDKQIGCVPILKLFYDTN